MDKIILLSLVIPLLFPSPSLAADLQSVVIGINDGEQVVATGVPLTSGAWGADYITVSHLLQSRIKYSITSDGKVVAKAQSVAACGRFYQGIDVLILRVREHRYRPVVTWGQAAELKIGEELQIFPYRSFESVSVLVRFLHPDFAVWATTHIRKDRQWNEWPPEARGVLVGEGRGRPGFSGSPWVKDGKVYGLHKGPLPPEFGLKDILGAEPWSKIDRCLKDVHYEYRTLVRVR